MTGIPHLRVVIAVCIAAIGGYAIFSGWVVFHDKNATMIGDVIGTWKSFAVLAFGFWLGSSSGGKTKTETPAGTKDDPFSVQGAAPDKKPVSTETADKPEES